MFSASSPVHSTSHSMAGASRGVKEGLQLWGPCSDEARDNLTPCYYQIVTRSIYNAKANPSSYFYRINVCNVITEKNCPHVFDS